MINHRINPCTNGFGPTDLIVSKLSPDPIRNKLKLSPRFANQTIKVYALSN